MQTDVCTGVCLLSSGDAKSEAAHLLAAVCMALLPLPAGSIMHWHSLCWKLHSSPAKVLCVMLDFVRRSSCCSRSRTAWTCAYTACTCKSTATTALRPTASGSTSATWTPSSTSGAEELPLNHQCVLITLSLCRTPSSTAPYMAVIDVVQPNIGFVRHCQAALSKLRTSLMAFSGSLPCAASCCLQYSATSKGGLPSPAIQHSACCAGLRT